MELRIITSAQYNADPKCNSRYRCLITCENCCGQFNLYILKGITKAEIAEAKLEFECDNCGCKLDFYGRLIPRIK